MYIKCFECNKDISMYIFNKHLKNNHNTNLINYYKKYSDFIKLYYITHDNTKYEYYGNLKCLQCGESLNIKFLKKINNFIITKECKCGNKYWKKRMLCFFSEDSKEFICEKKRIQEKDSAKNSLENYIRKHGEKEGTKKYNDKQKSTAGNLKNFIKRHGKEEGELRYKEFCEKSKQTKKNFIKRHGIEKGIEEWEKHIIKLKKTSKRSIEYWLIKTNYNEKLAKELHFQYQDFGSMKYFVEKYGEKEGKIRYREVSDSKGLTKENYIRKYGEKEGLIEYKKQIEKKQGIGNLNFYINRYGRELGIKKYKLVNKKRMNGFKNSYSKISQQLFWDIYKQISELGLLIYFADLNSEYFICDDNYKFKFYDFVIPELNFCLEYNGDLFHANPNIFNENDTPNPFNNLKSREIWDYDDYKKNLIQNKKDIEVFYVWDSDYRKEPDLELEKIINLIRRRYELYCGKN